MIISVSRRTDIPAFYASWLMNRVRAGYCTVPNPFNRKQVSYVSLDPEEVEAIVFWTRNPEPLLSYLDELDSRGFCYYFLYTLVNYPKQIDPYSPSLEKSVDVFRRLAERIGPERIIWRYDPIVLSNITQLTYHVDKFSCIAERLKGYSHRSVICFMDDYRKASKRVRALAKEKVVLHSSDNLGDEELDTFIPPLVDAAKANGIVLKSCAEDIDMTPYGVKPGKCIDDDLIRDLFRYDPSSQKDPSQRKECRCAVSKDIGMYDSCLYGCTYCYATQSFELSRKNHKEHDPHSPSMLGRYDAEPSAKQGKKKKRIAHQLNMFRTLR